MLQQVDVVLQPQAALYLFWTGQIPGAVLLKLSLLAFLFLLPSFVAFNRVQKKFWIVIVLNIALPFVQVPIFQKFFFDLIAMRPGNPFDLLITFALTFFGPGWVVLLI
ncbi:MAG TPA: hypothetical protein VJS85_09780, partial [Rhizomicrobium sp.]|nr:hypothetical protein [Rhizomicrobium sp.]